MQARNPLGDRGVEALCDGLRAALALEKLDLSDVGLTGTGVDALARIAARARGLRALCELRCAC